MTNSEFAKQHLGELVLSQEQIKQSVSLIANKLNT